MRINIENDIYLSSDKLGFYVEEKKLRNVRDKDTKEVTGTEDAFDVMGNYTTLAGAIYGLMKFKVAESKAATLEELLQDIQEHRAFIETKLGGI